MKWTAPLARYQVLAGLLYVASVVTLVMIVVFTATNVVARYRALNQSTEILARLETRAPAFSSETDWSSESVPPGSPFLQGPSVTVASAALLQRITTAITDAGGTLTSSEVDPQGEKSKQGFVRVLANCEIEQSGLQPLLYDLEAGMPFLFVDQIVAETQTSASEAPRLRIVLGVSGLWLGDK